MERYTRNIGALSPDQFKTLQNKKVCVIGCGGLGGYIIEELLRIGIGNITAVDFDVFEESNLNRQLLATSQTMGKSKAYATKDRRDIVNPTVNLNVIPEKFTEENGASIVGGHDIVIDALDSVQGRLILAQICSQLNIPILHGAIEEWAIQVSLIMPYSGLMETLYGDNRNLPQAPSSLASTVALCASLQVAEAIKYLTGLPTSLDGVILYFDLLTMDVEKIQI